VEKKVIKLANVLATVPIATMSIQLDNALQETLHASYVRVVLMFQPNAP
jgi:hypothetical protein